jgi:hypothetical protein
VTASLTTATRSTRIALDAAVPAAETTRIRPQHRVVRVRIHPRRAATSSLTPSVADVRLVSRNTADEASGDKGIPLRFFGIGMGSCKGVPWLTTPGCETNSRVVLGACERSTILKYVAFTSGDTRGNHVLALGASRTRSHPPRRLPAAPLRGGAVQSFAQL